MHSFEVHSNESACRKKVLLGLEQVYRWQQYTKSGDSRASDNHSKRRRNYQRRIWHRRRRKVKWRNGPRRGRVLIPSKLTVTRGTTRVGSFPKTRTMRTTTAKLRTQIPKWPLHQNYGPRIYLADPKRRTETIWKWRNKGHEVINAKNARQGGIPPNKWRATHQDPETGSAANYNVYKT